MQYESIDEMIRKLVPLDTVEKTRKLSEFYAKARFKVSPDRFNRQFTDGGNDGGIDFYHSEDSTYYILQTKFLDTPKKTNKDDVIRELRKIRSTLMDHNPNKKAEDFVSSLAREKNNKSAHLEIMWLTTNFVEHEVREAAQEELRLWSKDYDWCPRTDIVAIDRRNLDTVLFDVKHGYIPQTGKKTLKLEKNQWIMTTWETTEVESVVTIIDASDILGWFKDSDDVDSYLQKNVRQFLGDTSKVNEGIAKSYREDPDWFWYKHNGIIIFADGLDVDPDRLMLTMRNPQVVNGGQTLKTLFLEYDRAERKESTAKVLLRVYRLPYEDTETYKRSIEIISALNSQNKINPSDLKSTDPRQVRVEQLVEKLAYGFKYYRKRSKETRSTMSNITMRNLALRYYVCKKNSPRDGIIGNIENLFDDENKYKDIFNEAAINKDLSINHVVINYVTAWMLDQLLQSIELTTDCVQYFKFTRWLVLPETYAELMDWKKGFREGYQTWVAFLWSDQFGTAIQDYMRRLFRLVSKMIPKTVDERTFLMSSDTKRKFSSQSAKTAGLGPFLDRAYKKYVK